MAHTRARLVVDDSDSIVMPARNHEIEDASEETNVGQGEWIRVEDDQAHTREEREKAKHVYGSDACHATEARHAAPAAPRPRRDDAERARVGIALSRLSSDGDDTLARAYPRASGKKLI
jgi:hypothetical protein